MGRDDNTVKISVQRKNIFKKAQKPKSRKKSRVNSAIRKRWESACLGAGGGERGLVRFGVFSAREKIATLSLPLCKGAQSPIRT